MKIDSIWGSFFDWLGALVMACLMIITVMAVFCRYLLDAPLVWTEDVYPLLIMWTVMLGAVAAKRRNEHLRIAVLLERLSAKWRRRIILINQVLEILIIGVVGYFGFMLAMQAKYKVTNVLGIPFAWIDLAVPFGAVGYAAMCLSQIRITLAEGREKP